MRILLVKMSSLGDVVHNLPVVADVHRHHPQALIDWVVEEDYVPIPQLHPQVDRVLPIAWRRWRHQLSQARIRTEMAAFWRSLRRFDYDWIVDSQGLIKSALVGCCARRDPQGFRVGGDRRSIKEPLASAFYNRRVPVAWSRHVIDRNRAVAAAGLGYAVDTPPEYGIAPPPLHPTDAHLAQAPYAVLMHAASRAPKLWANANWVALGRWLSTQGLGCVLPWGSAAERARSDHLAQAIDGAIVPQERMDLSRAAGVLGASRLVVGLDTGFTHFAAALGRPVIGIFCDSDSQQAGACGAAPCMNFGFKGAAPQLDTVREAAQQLLGQR
jgi:heptosyltransferase-1